MKLSILLPSVDRVHLLDKCIQSLFNHSQGHEIELVLTTEDPTTLHYAHNAIHDGRFNRDNFQIVINWHNDRLGYMRSYNNALKLSTHPIIMPIGDDVELTNEALDEAAYAHKHRLNNYGVVGFNDGMHHGSTVVTQWIVDKKFLKDHCGGVAMYECYNAACSDLELNERAKRVNRLIWLPDAYLLHNHSANGKREFDDIDRAKMGLWGADNELFAQRKAQGFPNNFEAVI